MEMLIAHIVVSVVLFVNAGNYTMTDEQIFRRAMHCLDYGGIHSMNKKKVVCNSGVIFEMEKGK